MIPTTGNNLKSNAILKENSVIRLAKQIHYQNSFYESMAILSGKT